MPTRASIFGLLLLAASPLIAAKSGYVGAAALFDFDRVTVVYPAGPDQDAALNRLSAERRAAYLRHRHGVDAVVAPDDAVTDDQRRGHLLVLGWGNRLIGTEQAPSPFVRAPDGRLFLGAIRVGPGEDLLFATSSPYAGASRLVFWSRIDVELDRYLPMPLIGSDWAVFRLCTIERQGMFADSSGWPPRRNVEAEEEHAYARGRLAAQRESAHYTLHYVPGPTGDAEAPRILEARERALARAFERLGKPGDGFRIQLFSYPDKATKRAETDVADLVHGLPQTAELHMLSSFARADDPHEEIHLVARALWGPCSYTALYEGLAVALVPPASTPGLDVFAALFVDRGRLPTVAALLDEEELRRLMPEGTAFPAAGLLVRWLYDKGGVDAVRRAYVALPLTTATLGQIAGGSADAIEAEFRKWVEGRAAAAQDEYRFHASLAEARKASESGDAAAVVTALERAAKLRPQDPETMLRLALAQRAADRSSDAESLLRRLAALETTSANERYVALARYELGMLLRASGREEEARARLREVLELPDVEESHRRAREALEDAASGAPSPVDPG